MGSPLIEFQKVQEVIDKHHVLKSHLIAILQEVQEMYRYLPENVLAYIAEAMDMPPASVFGVATFYSQFSLVPKGKYVLRVCDGTACHVRGSEPNMEALRKKLGLKPGKDSTDDMMFTIETVSCLGACGLAPVMTVNDEEVYGQATPKEVVEIVDKIKEQNA